MTRGLGPQNVSAEASDAVALLVVGAHAAGVQGVESTSVAMLWSLLQMLV